MWTPQVTNEYEFSLSQIWVIAGSFGNDLNTIEAGWQACPYTLFFLTIPLNVHLISLRFQSPRRQQFLCWVRLILLIDGEIDSSICGPDIEF